jgi:hypothetical protein
LGEPGSAKNGGNWARSGHEKGFAANDRNWVVPGQAAFVKFSPKPDSLLPAQLTTFKAHQENPESDDW